MLLKHYSRHGRLGLLHDPATSDLWRRDGCDTGETGHLRRTHQLSVTPNRRQPATLWVAVGLTLFSCNIFRATSHTCVRIVLKGP